MKVIKRAVAENTATDMKTRTPPAKSQQEDSRGMVNVVKSWISERADNRRIEKAAATRSLFEWKTVVGD